MMPWTWISVLLLVYVVHQSGCSRIKRDENHSDSQDSQGDQPGMSDGGHGFMQYPHYPVLGRQSSSVDTGDSEEIQQTTPVTVSQAHHSRSALVNPLTAPLQRRLSLPLPSQLVSRTNIRNNAPFGVPSSVTPGDKDDSEEVPQPTSPTSLSRAQPRNFNRVNPISLSPVRQLPEARNKWGSQKRARNNPPVLASTLDSPHLVDDSEEVQRKTTSAPVKRIQSNALSRTKTEIMPLQRSLPKKSNQFGLVIDRNVARTRMPAPAPSMDTEDSDEAQPGRNPVPAVSVESSRMNAVNVHPQKETPSLWGKTQLMEKTRQRNNWQVRAPVPLQRQWPVYRQSAPVWQRQRSGLARRIAQARARQISAVAQRVAQKRANAVPVAAKRLVPSQLPTVKARLPVRPTMPIVPAVVQGSDTNGSDSDSDEDEKGDQKSNGQLSTPVVRVTQRATPSPQKRVNPTASPVILMAPRRHPVMKQTSKVMHRMPIARQRRPMVTQAPMATRRPVLVTRRYPIVRPQAPVVTPRRLTTRSRLPTATTRHLIMTSQAPIVTQRRLVVTTQKPWVRPKAKPTSVPVIYKTTPTARRPAVTRRTFRTTNSLPVTTRGPAQSKPTVSTENDDSDENDGSTEETTTPKPSAVGTKTRASTQRQYHDPLPPNYWRPAQHPPRQPVPYFGQVPSPADSSDSQSVSSDERGHGAATGPGRTPAKDESQGSDSSQTRAREEDSRESQEADSDEDGYDYYHPPPRPACPVYADVIIMLDGSDSLTEENFNLGKTVIDQVIAQMHLGSEDGYVVGVLVFSDSIQEIRLRPFKDNVYLRYLVMSTYQEMGGTGTDYALYNMRRLFFAEGRRSVPKIGVLMTDGRARNPSTAIEQARMAKLEGIRLITAAVGVVTNPAELRAVASSPRDVILNPSAAVVLNRIRSYSSVRCPGPGAIPVPYPKPQPGIPPTYRPPTYPPPRTLYPGQTTRVPPPPGQYTPRYTPRPVTPVPPRKGPCDDCKFLNGVGYNPHESVCSYFYQCFNNSGVLVPYQQTCPFSLFWDQNDLTCKPAASVDCATDRCKRSPRPYSAPGNCRAYWQCQWGRTIGARCCPYSHRFDIRTRTCVFDYSCTVPCPPKQPVRPDVCRFRPDSRDRTQYYEDTPTGVVLRRCAQGTIFVPAPACRCEMDSSVGPRPYDCRPDLYLPFDGDFRDQSGQNLAVFTDKVAIDRTPGNGATGGGAARFNGNGRIFIWKYANDDFGTQFVIRLRYQALPSTNTSQSEGLVTNSDCREPCSVAISYNRENNSTTAKLRTEDTGIVRSILPHGPDWNEVEYRYDGNRLTFTLNGNSQSLAAQGNIAKVPTALQIGTGCMGYDPFTGLIDELYVYKCIPRDL